MLCPQLAKEVVQLFPWHSSRSAAEVPPGIRTLSPLPLSPYLPNPLA